MNRKAEQSYTIYRISVPHRTPNAPYFGCQLQSISFVSDPLAYLAFYQYSPPTTATREPRIFAKLLVGGAIEL